MRQIGRWIAEGVEATKAHDEARLARIRDDVRELAESFPVPGV